MSTQGGAGRVQLEIAVQDVDGALTARSAGAHRVELCSALELGGITPSQGLIERSCAELGPAFGVHVLVRPRPGDFCYSAGEAAVIVADVAAAVASGARGVVVGALRRGPAGLGVDVELLQRIRDVAGDAEVTFHRAIDLLPDPVSGLAMLAAAGVRRVLSSGGASDVQTGLPVLSRMVAEAAGRIEVMAGGGVRVESIPEIRRAGVDAVHLSAKRAVTVDQGISLGSATASGEMTWFRTDRDTVERAAALLGALGASA
jgi:copper homeostasis protein